MSAPVDVLAVMDRLIGNARTMAGLTGDPRARDNLREGEQARDAVAELIEADKNYDAAQVAFAIALAKCDGQPLGSIAKQCAKADIRRATAIACCGVTP